MLLKTSLLLPHVGPCWGCSSCCAAPAVRVQTKGKRTAGYDARTGLLLLTRQPLLLLPTARLLRQLQQRVRLQSFCCRCRLLQPRGLLLRMRRGTSCLSAAAPARGSIGRPQTLATVASAAAAAQLQVSGSKCSSEASCSFCCCCCWLLHAMWPVAPSSRYYRGSPNPQAVLPLPLLLPRNFKLTQQVRRRRLL